MTIEGVYFDGETARDNKVRISLDPRGLQITGDTVSAQTWSLSGLRSIDPPHAGQPLRLSHYGQPGARLIISDPEFTKQLLAQAPNLKGGFNSKHALRLFLWIGGGLLILAGLIYLTLSFAPQKLAVLLPDGWSRRVGDQMEASLVGGAKICQTFAGEKAVGAMLANLAEGNPDIPPLRVRIYDIPIVNAFALPGGHIVLTRGLLNSAATAGEVAGVLAHEIGHVAYHHPEAQLVRIAGVQILLSIATGTSGGTNASSLAGLAAILKSSRDAEREADSYAVAILSAARVDPMGLKHFFEKIMAEEGESTGGTLSRLGTAFSTHPVTLERIELIQPLPAGTPLKPPISEDQWRDLKAICD
jgi:Zn-dependent protease with chaperone function